MNPRLSCFATAAIAALIVIPAAAAQCPVATFVGLGVPLGSATNTGSVTSAISADGSAVVGYAPTVNSRTLAFRWTAATGMQDLGTLPDDYSATALSVSADGATVVGGSFPWQGNARAFRWTSAMGMTVLGGPNTVASALSGDASVAVGNIGSSAVLWSGAGQQSLGACPPCLQNAQSMSADGTVIVGNGTGQVPAGFYAWRWTSSGGVQYLANDPLLPGTTFARAASGDGRITAGFVAAGGAPASFKPVSWRSDGSLRELGIPAEVLAGPNPRGQFAGGVNGTGSVIVGSFRGGHAFVWTEALGALDIETVLRVYGANLNAWTLYESVAVSANGSVLAGTGGHTLPNGALRTEAWVASVPMLLSVQPAPHRACFLSTDQLVAAAVGTARPFLFVWRKNGTPIAANEPRFSTLVTPDGTSSSLTISNVQVGDAGVYDCVVTSTLGNCGTMTTLPAAITVCPADFDCNDALQVGDIFGYLNAWFAGEARTDINGGGISVQDVFDFLIAWFAGCA